MMPARQETPDDERNVQAHSASWGAVGTQRLNRLSARGSLTRCQLSRLTLQPGCHADRHSLHNITPEKDRHIFERRGARKRADEGRRQGGGPFLLREPSPDVEDDGERFSNLRKIQRPDVASSLHDPLR